MIPKEKLPTIPIKGKDYVQAHTRLLELHKQNDKFSLTTEIISDDEKRVTMQTTLKIDDRIFTGIASELKNQEKPYENCETSSCARCLGFFGIGIIESIASADCMVSYENTKSEKPSYSSDSGGKKMMTEKQKATIIRTIEEKKLNPDNYILDGLSLQQASELISALFDLKKVEE